MKRHPLFRACWYAVNSLLIVSAAAVLYSAAWEFSTRCYLKGFSDAIIPASDTPKKKVEGILDWMAHGPARNTTADVDTLALRNPENTLNIQELLRVCGTATNAFVNLAQSSGLKARRLLLLDENGISKHVVAEVLIEDRWVVVDPSYRAFLALPNGRTLTREELKNPIIFHAASRAISNYPQSYTYERAVHIRLAGIPVLGHYFQNTLNLIWPTWEEAINWTLLLERESFGMLVMSTLLLSFGLTIRLLLSWYCSSRIDASRIRLRDQIKQASQVLVGRPSLT